MKKRVLSLLSGRRGHALALKEVSRKLNIHSDEDYRALRELVHGLVRSGIIESDHKGRFSYVAQRKQSSGPAASPSSGRVTGKLSVVRSGGGFVRSEGSSEEIFIPARYMHTALHGDRVAVVRFAGRTGRVRRGKTTPEAPEGEVIEILERGTTVLTGRLEKGRHFYFVVPDNERYTRDIYISAEDAGKGRHGDKVVVELLPWTDEHLNPEGTIIDVLGPSGDARVEVMSVARTFGLPLSFPGEVLREADALPASIGESDLQGRLDFRPAVCVTIDPEDAKDFDDAVSVELLDEHHWRLGVHIADVSHYVREGSALDQEALARGTSAYLVNEVIPMLPERLSNDLCSLRPRCDRLTYSVIMDVNRYGTVESCQIRRSVIHSARRFTYEEVQHIIDSGRGECAETILPLFRLSRLLLLRRRRNGSLDLDTPEAKFRFDEQGLPSGIVKKERLDAHRLVEECMLLANKAVAKHISAGGDMPFLYRVHDVPDQSRIEELARFVKQFGFTLSVSGGVTSRVLQRLLDQAKGSEVEGLINEVVLRSMAKAVYATKNIGHYGLGFRHYAHFTSPIRRYPDLIVHRLLQEYERKVSASRLHELGTSLPDVARQSSERERVAMEAERASVKVMQAEYMKRHLGDELEGVISGVTSFGFFVEVDDLLVEGLVPVRDLGDDYYLFDEKHYALKGRSSGKSYRLGDRVRVRVAAIDAVQRQIDFAVVS